VWQRLFGTRVPAEQFADLLFEKMVLGDEVSFREKHLAYTNTADNQTETFRKQVFVYLAATVAVVLTNEASRQPIVSAVVARFRQRVTTEALRRWGGTEGDTDQAVEAAASNLARLFFTDPQNERSLSFDWAREWLAAAGIDETNPSSLFLVSSLWKNQDIYLAKMVREFHIAP
jgi:hypothetical protein